MSETKTSITFYGASDDLLEAEFETEGVVDEMDASVGGWELQTPDGEFFAVVGEYTSRGHWRLALDFAPGVDEEGGGPPMPSDIEAYVGQKIGTPYSTHLTVRVPAGSILRPLDMAEQGLDS